MILEQIPRLLRLCLVPFFLVAPLPVRGSTPGPSSPPGPEALFLVVFTPTTEGNTYWPEVHRAMAAAAEDLGVGIRFFEFPVDDRFAKFREGAALLRQDPAPAGAIFSVAFGQARPLAEVARERGIPFLIQGPLFPEEENALGGAPRKVFSNWTGTFREDEEEKGFLLAQTLIDAAAARGRHDGEGFIQVVGIGGDTSWFGSRLREAGLRRAVEADPRAQLLQTVPTRWTPEEGEAMAVRLLQRYPQVSVIWAASDQLALGAVQGIRSQGGSPGETHFTGGLDLSMTGLRAVRAGTLTATVASSVYSYAELVVYLYDYLQGIDFADEIGTDFSPRPYRVTGDNAAQVLELLKMYREVDYRRFSKHHNPGMGRYDFSLSRLPELLDDPGNSSPGAAP
ncbi:hypothetical protein AU468_09100 [Alkalispirochaeta sphaeroplastigenens]|uniref:Periplasmic binding protein domain-containing protein n=1 Tax=Alkalispirochaeta sphaeroplastigenens TaxID=1187066 RepID=A0A2S4JND4_9SPIO|nr:ABC transporter substrate-binding protein [Alkalispirochaeta sphaeroplastigenens]POR01012.1 hypothetical protein AU468_09100 [Alkalispirochaeta sphaeroplastigenens]